MHTFEWHANRPNHGLIYLTVRSLWPSSGHIAGALYYLYCSVFYFLPFPLSYLPKAEFVFIILRPSVDVRPPSPDYCCNVRFDRFDSNILWPHSAARWRSLNFFFLLILHPEEVL